MKHLFTILASLAGLAAFTLASGFLVPRRYEGAFIIEVQAAPEAIWAVLEAPEAYPSWRSDVTKVEPVPGNPLAWRELHPGGGTTRHVAIPERPHEKFIDRFEAEGAPGNRGIDGGISATRGERIILMVTDAKGNTRVSITERGDVDGPLDRFRARFVDGYRAGPRKLGEDLRKRLGE